MKIINNMSTKIDHWSENLHEQLDRLQPRDRLAIIVLSVFLVITLVLALLWFANQGAVAQQKRLIDLKETIHWMQSNAVKFPTQTAEMATASEKLQRIAQQQGLSVQSQDQDGQLKMVTSHQNYAVLANLLTELAQQGVTIVSLDMQKQADDGLIRLTATLQ